MKPSSRKRNQSSTLSPSVRRRADLYLLAASAGICLPALAQTAQAEIVYTPANTTLPLGSQLYVDLNHDGMNDFVFENYPDRGLGSTTFLLASGINSGAGIRERFKHALALPPGAKISPDEMFSNSATMTIAYNGSGGGTWGRNRYLGLKFKIDGETHYGWAEFSVGLNQRGKLMARLEGYAYETVANKPILAGKTGELGQGGKEASPATIAALALGWAGLSMWRK